MRRWGAACLDVQCRAERYEVITFFRGVIVSIVLSLLSQTLWLDKPALARTCSLLPPISLALSLSLYFSLTRSLPLSLAPLNILTCNHITSVCLELASCSYVGSILLRYTWWEDNRVRKNRVLIDTSQKVSSGFSKYQLGSVICRSSIAEKNRYNGELATKVGITTLTSLSFQSSFSEQIIKI